MTLILIYLKLWWVESVGLLSFCHHRFLRLVNGDVMSGYYSSFKTGFDTGLMKTTKQKSWAMWYTDMQTISSLSWRVLFSTMIRPLQTCKGPLDSKGLWRLAIIVDPWALGIRITMYRCYQMEAGGSSPFTSLGLY